MKGIIFLKGLSVFSGALSVVMELHLLYLLLYTMYEVIKGDVISSNMALIPIDLLLIAICVVLHYYISSNMHKFSEERSDENEPKDAMERGSGPIT